MEEIAIDPTDGSPVRQKALHTMSFWIEDCWFCCCANTEMGATIMQISICLM